MDIDGDGGRREFGLRSQRRGYGFLNPMPEPQMLTRIIPHSPPAPADDDDAPMGAGTRHHWPRGEMTPEEIAEALRRAT